MKATEKTEFKVTSLLTDNTYTKSFSWVCDHLDSVLPNNQFFMAWRDIENGGCFECNVYRIELA